MMEDYAQYALPEEERRRLLLSNLMMGLGAGLLDSLGKNVWPAISTGLLGGMQMGQQAIGSAQRGMVDSYKLKREIDADKEKKALADAAAGRQKEMEDALAGIFSGSPNLSQMGPGGPTPENLARVSPPDRIAQYRKAADFYMAKNDVAKAKEASAMADKLEEEYSQTPQTVRDAAGNLRLAQFGKRGGVKVAEGMTPAEKLHFANTGGMAGVGLDPYSGAQVSQGLPTTVTPDAQLSADTARRGQDLTNARAREANAITSAGTASGKVAEFRKEFNALPVVKDYNEIQPTLQSVREAAKQDNAAADMNIVYGVAKIFDPQGVVRSSDSEMVVAAGSPAQKYVGLFNYLARGGGKLTPEVRAQLLNEVESRARGREAAYRAARKTYEGIATQNQIPHDQVFIDPFITPQTATTTAPAAGPKPGDVKVGNGGKRYRFAGGDPSKKENWIPE